MCACLVRFTSNGGTGKRDCISIGHDVSCAQISFQLGVAIVDNDRSNRPRVSDSMTGLK